MNDNENLQKNDKNESDGHSAKSWNLDPRNESFYLGKINPAGDNDLNMRYYTDGKTDRYYRKGEIIPQEEYTVVKYPFLNNSLEGKRKRNFSFRIGGSSKKKKEEI